MRRSVAARLFRTALDLVLPAPCLGCGRATEETRPFLGLCLPCRGRLRAPARPACAHCGRLVPSSRVTEGWLCGDCRKRRLPYGRLLAAWRYGPPIDAVIRSVKFRRLELLAGDLAAGMARELARPDDVDLLVPVPLHWRRRLSRGFDQAEILTRHLARAWALPWQRVLTRRRATSPQTGLEANERRANLEGAFGLGRAPGRASVTNRAVLLVDDVLTTGATLRAAALALRRAGARVPAVAVAAATPPPGSDRRGRDSSREPSAEE